MSFLLVACGEGTTVADLPSNLTGVFAGEFSNNAGTDSGTMTFNMVEAEDGTISGVLTIDKSICLLSGTIDSSVSSASGFTARITVVQNPSMVNDEGQRVGGGDIIFQVTTNDTGFAGTYTVAGDTSCSNNTGSGTVEPSR